MRMLLDFAVQGHIGQSGKAAEAELARREATLTLDLADERLGFRESSVIQANEPDAERRAVLERARLAVIATDLTHLHAELIGCQHAAARELGYGSYRELCAACKGVDLMGLAEQVAAFTAASTAGYAAALEDPLRRSLGYGLDASAARGHLAVHAGAGPRRALSRRSAGRML